MDFAIKSSWIILFDSVDMFGITSNDHDIFSFAADIQVVVSRHVECVCLLSSNNTKPKDSVETGMDTDDYFRIKNAEKESG